MIGTRNGPGSAARRLIMAKETAIVGYRIGQANGRSYVVRVNFEAPRANDYSNLPVDAACAK